MDEEKVEREYQSEDEAEKLSEERLEDLEPDREDAKAVKGGVEPNDGWGRP